MALLPLGSSLLAKQLRSYIDRGHGANNGPFVMYGQSAQATMGIYIGQGLLYQGVSKSAFKIFQDNLANLDILTPSIAIQLCGPGYDSTRIFGVAVTSNAIFAPIQSAINA